MWVGSKFIVIQLYAKTWHSVYLIEKNCLTFNNKVDVKELMSLLLQLPIKKFEGSVINF